MSEKRAEDVAEQADRPEGEDVGDISSGHGEAKPAGEPSDEKAAAMIARHRAEAAGGSAEA